jgi:hypothetical protein
MQAQTKKNHQLTKKPLAPYALEASLRDPQRWKLYSGYSHASSA